MVRRNEIVLSWNHNADSYTDCFFTFFAGIMNCQARLAQDSSHAFNITSERRRNPILCIERNKNIYISMLD